MRAAGPACALLSAGLLLAGCGAQGPVAPSPGAGSSAPAGPAEPVSPVYTDCSKLTPYRAEEGLYGVFEPYQGDRLTAREDYGVLLPYVGARITTENYIVDELPLYGLMTMDGRVVTEPVYNAVDVVCDGEGLARFLLLIETYGDPAWFESGEDTTWVENCREVTAAAPDGSWIVSGGYRAAEPVDGTHLALYREDSSITLLDAGGTVSAFFPGEALGVDFWFWNDAGSPYVLWQDGLGYLYGEDGTDGPVAYLDTAAGRVLDRPPPGAAAEPSDPWNDRAYGGGPEEAVTDPATGRRYVVPEREGGDAMDILDTEGMVLWTGRSTWESYGLPLVYDGRLAAVEDGWFCYYALEDGNCVFRFPIRTNHD